MKSLKLLLFSISIGFLFTGCSAIGATIGALGSVVFESPNLDLEKKKWLEKLMNENKHVLLSEDEKVRAAKNICALNHLDKDNLSSTVYKDAEEFCKLEEDDKVYFLEDMTNIYGMTYRRYLLVRDDTPFEIITIGKKYSKELGRHILVIERLH
jgi:uncharacterized membrane protein YgaE (UPF0421/DUF939 family)